MSTIRHLKEFLATLYFIFQCCSTRFAHLQKIEQEVNQIRLWIYEETKELTPLQRAKRTNKIAEAAAQKYGFAIIANANERAIR